MCINRGYWFHITTFDVWSPFYSVFVYFPNTVTTLRSGQLLGVYTVDEKTLKISSSKILQQLTLGLQKVQQFQTPNRNPFELLPKSRCGIVPVCLHCHHNLTWSTQNSLHSNLLPPTAETNRMSANCWHHHLASLHFRFAFHSLHFRLLLTPRFSISSFSLHSLPVLVVDSDVYK